MATLTDQVIMPGSDYQAICDATRTLTGKTETLKSGDISTELGTVLQKPETWIINEVPNFPSNNIGQKIPFIAYAPRERPGVGPFYSYCYNMLNILRNGRICFYKDGNLINAYMQEWKYLDCRRVSFLTPPSGDLLAWLTDNAVKITDDESYSYNVQKSLDYTVKGLSVKVITPTPPYDSLRKVIIKTNVVEQATPSISVHPVTGEITSTVTQTEAGWVKEGTKTATQQLATQAAKTVTPTEAEQIAVAAGKYTTGYVEVAAIPTTYVGSGVAKKSSSDLTANGATVTAPAGYYENAASKSLTIVEQATPQIGRDSSTGKVNAYTTQATGYVVGGTKNTTIQLPTQTAKTITPTASEQIAVEADKYTLGDVKVAAVPTETKTVDLSMVSGNQTISNTSGKYMTSVTVKKPDTLIEKNVRYGHGIGGVVGTYSPHVCVFPKLISVSALLDNAATTTYDVEFWYGDDEYCTAIRATPQNVLYYYHEADEVWHEVYKNNQWLTEAYRKIVLTEYKSNVETALEKIGYIQEDKAVDPITIQKVYTSNGSYSILPDAPYNGISEVQLQVDVPSGVDLPFTLVSTQTINDGVVTFTSSTSYRLLIAKSVNSTAGVQFAAFSSVAPAQGSEITKIGSTDGSASFLIDPSYVSKTLSGNTYTYTWTVASSSSSDFYENTIKIYGI